MLFRPRRLILKSYAKINVSLHLDGRREDAYHNLDMVVLPFSIHDVIEVAIAPRADHTKIVCDDATLMKNHRDNLCTRAVEAMRNHFGFKEQFSISIHKEIPFAAGLGGGSSNAAVVMKAINQLLNLGASQETLEAIGLTLGADVPFFIRLKPARVQGIGEILTEIHPDHEYYCLAIRPERGLKTADVFVESDKYEPQENTADAVVEALEKGDDLALANSMRNDLYAPACALYPELVAVVAELKRMGFPLAAMTGSGSACFALSTDKAAIQKAEAKLIDRGYDVYLGKTTIKE